MKKHNEKFKIRKRNGVVLLMVVFMMSIFLSAGLVLSVVFLRSLKSSQYLAESLIAFHAADSGLEHLIYLVRNDIALPIPTANCDGSSNGFAVGSACYVLEKKTNGVIFVYAFGKFPSGVAGTARVSRSLGALFEK